MKLMQILVIAVGGVALAAVVRPIRKEMGMLIGAATGLIVLGAAVAEWSGLIDALREFAAAYGVDTGYIGLLLKIIGIAYLAQFGAQICTDAGETAVAGKVELFGRVMILLNAFPAAAMTVATAVELLGGKP